MEEEIFKLLQEEPSLVRKDIVKITGFNKTEVSKLLILNYKENLAPRPRLEPGTNRLTVLEPGTNRLTVLFKD